ncbi:MAG: MFS transporter [Candidatus Lokiarchaeota archaeon]|nr:MFS transporter [Candidatus Lokiarchaeota archaeon]MBD3201211.1 MFS transporter [Candidatus Lokiarchaeota archaeon]
MNEINESSTMNYSTKVHASYSLGSFFDDFLATSLSYMVFKFYETEIFLPVFYITLGVIIYGLWNMVNDPLAGHISDGNYKFMKKYGKRFTWFLLTSIPCSVIFVFIFLPPRGNDLITFSWLILILCILDTLFSFTIINWQSLFPDKFRTQKERTKVGGIQILFSLFGLAFGTLIPTLIITSGTPGTNIESYFIVGIIVTIALLIVSLLMIYGMKENKRMIDRTFIQENMDEDKEKYYQKIKFALKQKNFIAYLFAYLAQTTVMVLMLASIPYWLEYILKVDDFYEMVILVVFLLSSVISSPFWIKIARKYGNRIGYMCGTLGTGISLIATMFIWQFPYVLIGFIFIGFCMGATWSLIYPAFSDVIDEIVVKTERREEGIYYGFRTFIGRFSIVIQALTFGIIHTLTFFNPTSSTQPILAQWGIIIGMFLVPAIFYLIGFLFMWKVYDLTPKIVQNNKQKLIHLEL